MLWLRKLELYYSRGWGDVWAVHCTCCKDIQQPLLWRRETTVIETPRRLRPHCVGLHVVFARPVHSIGTGNTMDTISEVCAHYCVAGDKGPDISGFARSRPVRRVSHLVQLHFMWRHCHCRVFTMLWHPYYARVTNPRRACILFVRFIHNYTPLIFFFLLTCFLTSISKCSNSLFFFQS